MFRLFAPSVVGVACLLGAVPTVWAQKAGEAITLNFVGAEIEAVARTMGVRFRIVV